MPTNVGGDQARLFPWQMVHYIVHGGPNDPTKSTVTSGSTTITAPSSTDGGYLSALTPASAVNFVTLPPVPGSQTPPNIPIPRTQQIFGGSASAAALTAGNFQVTNNAGGVYLGTIPQGSWIESIEMYVYSIFTGNAGVINTVGIFYAAADSTSTTNTTGLQPTTLQAMAFLGGATAANTLYSTETGTTDGRVAFTGPTTAGVLGLGPGVGSVLFGSGSLASTSDIDLYFVAYGTGSTALGGGSASVRIKFTGLEG